MQLDDEVCLCCHVSLRKLLNFARRKHPRHTSQMSECLGAGTGCGWCIPVLKKIHQQVTAETNSDEPSAPAPDTPTAEEYAEARRGYLQTKRKNTF